MLPHLGALSRTNWGKTERMTEWVASSLATCLRGPILGMRTAVSVTCKDPKNRGFQSEWV